MNLKNHQTPHQVSRQGWWGVRRSWADSPRLRAILAGVAAALGILCVLLWRSLLSVPVTVTVSEPTVSAGATVDETGREIVLSPTGERLLSRDIDGIYVSRGKEHPDLVAVVIDNMTDARPAAGLTKAVAVIETLAEGGITRHLALFPLDGDAAKIGPVRSARPYFVDWADEYDAIFAHVGGSPEALDRLVASDVRDANEYFSGAYFWRGPERRAPHNTYISLESVRQLKDRRFADRRVRQLTPWKFVRGPVLPAGDASADIIIDWSTPAYKVRWQFDQESGQYVRHQGGKPMTDEDGTVVRAATVVVQFAKMRVLDEVGRRRIVTTGTGSALVATGGRTVEASWERKNLGDRTRFLVGEDEAGFTPGTVWIEVVPSALRVSH